MNNLENRLKSLRNQKQPLPSMVSTRIEQTLAGLPEKKKKKKPFIYGAAAAVLLFLLLTGSAYYSPAMAKTLQSLPIIGSVFEKVGDPGLKKAGQEGLVTQFDRTIEANQESLAFTDVVYDGTRLSIGYIKQWDPDANLSRTQKMHDLFDDIRFKVNGKQIGNYELGGRGKFLNGHQYAGVMTLTTNQELPDHFNLTVVIHHLGRQKGRWTASFPVQKISGQKTFLVNEVKTYKNKTIVLNKVTFTPATTEVSFNLKEPLKTEEQDQLGTIEYQLFNDQGMMLQPFGAGGGGSPENGIIVNEMTAHYEPVKKVPSYLIFQPVVMHYSKKAPQKVKAEWAGKPLKLSQGKAGEILIKDIQHENNKTILTYRVEGKAPYRQAGAVWLVDENGGSYHSNEPPKKISDKKYLFQRTFPVLDPSGKLKVVTVKLQPPTPIKSLRMKIPLNR